MKAAPRVQYRVSMVTACFMVGIAALLDAAQVVITITGVLIPLDDLITFLAIPIFGLWFLISGVSYFSGKKAAGKVVTALASTAVELVPVVDALPTITAGVIGIIHASRAEDRLKVPKPANDNVGSEDWQDAA